MLQSRHNERDVENLEMDAATTDLEHIVEAQTLMKDL
jgi:hypothetical protein